MFVCDTQFQSTERKPMINSLELSHEYCEIVSIQLTDNHSAIFGPRADAREWYHEPIDAIGIVRAAQDDTGMEQENKLVALQLDPNGSFYVVNEQPGFRGIARRVDAAETCERMERHVPKAALDLIDSPSPLAI